MEKRTDRAEMVVRIPRDVKSWLEEEAARTGASQNSEVIRALRERQQKVAVG
jgi:predicted HicB family RNase H-like nuclease